MPIGGVLREAWSMYKAHWRHLLSISFVFYVLISLLALLLVILLDLVGVIAAVFVAFGAVFWLQGVLVEAVADVRGGRADLSVRETLARARLHFNRLSLFGLFILFVTWLGMIPVGAAPILVLAIIPALLFLFTQWLLAVPVMVLEGAGVFGSLGRSRELVRGYGWRVFGLLVATSLIFVAVWLACLITLVWLPRGVGVPAANVVASTLIAPYAALAWTLAYYRLRDPRGRTASQSLA